MLSSSLIGTKSLLTGVIINVDPPQVILGTSSIDILNGGSGNDTISGFGGMDIINGNAGDDLINGGADDDILNGGSGNDTAIFSGNRSSYSISVNGSGLAVRGLDGNDLISNIEFLKFNDQTISGLPNPNINISLSSNRVIESGAANLVYTFTRSDSFTIPLSSPFTVDFSLGGTATFNSDYTQTGASIFNGTTGSITFTPNSTTATLILDPTDDNILESDETVIFTLSSNGNTSVITSTIVDDEIPNQAPTNLNISNSNIEENKPTSSVIGSFSSIDPDLNSTFTYSLISGTGDTDNSLFVINNDTLETNAIFNYEAKNSYNIRVRTTDQGGLSFEKALTINVINVNEAPIVVNAIPTQNAEENSPFNFTIPTNTFNDIDVGDVLTYSAVRSDGTALPTWLTFNPVTGTFSGQPSSGDVGSLSVKVIATDIANSQAENVFDIVINPQFNIINGTPSSETLIGTSANDLILGLAGNDVLLGFAGNNILVGEDGNDILVGGDGKNILVGGDGDDILVGGSGNNLLVGGSGNNLLIGGNSSDILVGGDGNNILVGGFGNDILVGGSGNDLIAFDINEIFDLSKIGQDSIIDFFAPTDKIILNKTTFNSLVSIVGSGFSQGNEFAIVTTDAAAQTSGALITYNSTNGNLFYNQNGSASEFGSGGLFVNLSGNPNLSANNFLITG